VSRVHQRLNVLAICLLGGVLGAVLVVQIWPHGRALAQAGMKEEDEWTWPKTLQVYAAQPGDPVKLVKITKGGEELLAWKYKMPQIAGDASQIVAAVKDWLSDVSFTLKSQTSKNIAALSIAVVLPVRGTDLECNSITGEKSAREPWCEAHPHWCDGGCPELVTNTLHWGLIPAQAASGLHSRYKAEAKGIHGDRTIVEGKGLLRVGPGEEVTLLVAGRVDGMGAISDPRHGVPDTVNGLLYWEGIEEAKDAEPCSERRNSKKGCAFSEVSKFNIGLDVIYFEDGTIWGSYGYGYAIPNPDGIFTRVSAYDSPSIGKPASGPN